MALTNSTTASDLRAARNYHQQSELEMANALDALKGEPSSFQKRVAVETALKRLEFYTAHLHETSFARTNYFRGAAKRALGAAKWTPRTTTKEG